MQFRDPITNNSGSPNKFHILSVVRHDGSVEGRAGRALRCWKVSETFRGLGSHLRIYEIGFLIFANKRAASSPGIHVKIK